MSDQVFTTSFSGKISLPVMDVWYAWADQTKWSSWVLMDITNEFIVGGEYHNGKGEGGKYLDVLVKT
jgi:uncharacterized protein YndB with AHSA1/START domain